VSSPSIVSLVKAYLDAFKRWVMNIKDLASLELSEQGKKAGIGAGLFAGAAFFGVFAFLLLTFALVYLLVEVVGLSTWLSFLLVAVLYLIIAGILALVGKNVLSALAGPKRTVAAVKAGPGFPLGSPSEEERAVTPV
jgi:hypothetical protein